MTAGCTAKVKSYLYMLYYLPHLQPLCNSKRRQKTRKGHRNSKLGFFFNTVLQSSKSILEIEQFLVKENTADTFLKKKKNRPFFFQDESQTKCRETLPSPPITRHRAPRN